MTLDIRGSLKNTKISANRYVVLEELISNSIDSFLIRQHQDPLVRSLDVRVVAEVLTTSVVDGAQDLCISCTDNGCGLGEEQMEAFLTKDTSYKDDLSIAGIGKCKGAGRIQYFHHFERVGIRSTYQSDGKVLTRTLPLVAARKKIDRTDFTVSEGEAGDIGTTITLDTLKPGVRERFYRIDTPSEIFSAANMRRYMLVAFLQRLVSLKTELGQFSISFQTKNPHGRIETLTLTAADLPPVTEVKSVLVEERDPQAGSPLGSYANFTLSHYKLDASVFDLPRNAISFCAKSSPVQDITRRYLRTVSEQNRPLDGFHHIVLIESELLDRRVNEQRDGFEGIPNEIPTGDLFDEEKVSYAGIYDCIDPIIEAMVSPSGWSRDDVIADAAERFGVNPGMLADTDTRVVYGDNAKSVAERVLRKYQERIIADTAEIFDLREEIEKAEPHTANFRQKINELSWKYASSLKTFDMANLSQLVVRRAAIVEILALACKRQLAVQVVAEGVRRQDERVIHSIFFPMKRDSLETSDHDIWLLSEEYQYYDYIASDKPLSEIEWNDGEKLFDPGIDDELAATLRRRAEENGAMRPDIAIFDKEGSAIIIEFKAPGVSLDDHVGDLSEYAHLLAAKSNGRLKKFYGYLIGDTVAPLRMAGWTRFAAGHGYFRSTPLQDPETGRNLGELYAETLFFDDIVRRATKRIGVYRDKLQLDLSKK
ncbi:hypothetical protein [Sphingomonas astaxanthinifaciens]|uniref:Histidine kinase-, DNA gyrase B-, and HSP90-like ATPase n=1 Tax=Sphingomonas astaxanthinifaciens DSM 22298 TaxID=1123267 RepID=A0ABQ5Z6J6_9SPHN|nr:hypothetical protein [Sphingomonas astaxanthinifaciens]GLR47655.1 hypothetical protein GCM10007925_13680 [Sphingomonas astaxanthinifaciens DSM 22298]